MKEMKQQSVLSSHKPKEQNSIHGAALKPSSDTALLIQPKLMVGSPNDPLEYEADQAADRLLGLWQSGKWNVPAEAQHNLTKSPFIQRRAASPAASAVQASPQISSQIEMARGGGQALPATLQPSLEAAFGMDFSGIRLHTDERADALNRSLQARAFTTGQDIFFRQGAYQPGTAEGVKLLGHELGHVGQQASGSFYIARRLLEGVDAMDAVRRYNLRLSLSPRLPSGVNDGRTPEAPYRAIKGQNLQIRLNTIDTIPNSLVQGINLRVATPNGEFERFYTPGNRQFTYSLNQSGIYRIMVIPRLRMPRLRTGESEGGESENNELWLTRFVQTVEPNLVAQDASQRIQFPTSFSSYRNQRFESDIGAEERERLDTAWQSLAGSGSMAGPPVMQQRVSRQSSADSGSMVNLPSVYINLTNGQISPLILFIRIPVRTSIHNRITLYDLTPTAIRTRYGENSRAAFDDFRDNNSYPRGLIRIELPQNHPGLPEGPILIWPTGSTAAGEVASTLSWMSLLTTGFGLAALLVPGGQGVGALLLSTSGMLGATSAAAQLSDHLSRDRVSSDIIALDLLGIAGSLLSVTSPLVSGSLRRLTSICDIAATGAEAIMLTPQLLEQIDTVRNSALSPEEKRQQIALILANGIVSGAMYYHGTREAVRDIRSGGASALRPQSSGGSDASEVNGRIEVDRRTAPDSDVAHSDIPPVQQSIGQIESGIQTAIQSRNIGAYIEALRTERSMTMGGRAWDYTAFPNSGGHSWQPGMPIDMPDRLGEYPTYATARPRYWRNRAHFELVERRLGHVSRDSNAWDDPIRQMTDAQLRNLQDTPTARVRSPRISPSRVMELEHMGVPQRVAGWLEEITANGRTIFTPSEARRITEVANPTYLFETTPLGHAFFDYYANLYPGRADVSGRRPMTTTSSDERVHSPLSRMPDHNIRSIVERLNQHVGQVINIPIGLRQGLERVIRERPTLADLTLPSSS